MILIDYDNLMKNKLVESDDYLMEILIGRVIELFITIFYSELKNEIIDDNPLLVNCLGKFNKNDNIDILFKYIEKCLNNIPKLNI